MTQTTSEKQEVEVIAHQVIALEQAALAKWGKGDPSELLNTYAADITYFDSATKSRIDGRDAMATYYQPLPGTILWSTFEMIEPKVQCSGNVAVLTYRLHSEGTQNGKPADRDWNSTSVYTRSERGWQMIHSHWSLTALPAAAGIM